MMYSVSHLINCALHIPGVCGGHGLQRYWVLAADFQVPNLHHTQKKVAGIACQCHAAVQHTQTHGQTKAGDVAVNCFLAAMTTAGTSQVVEAGSCKIPLWSVWVA